MLNKFKNEIKEYDFIDLYLVIGLVICAGFIITNLLFKSKLLSYLTQGDVMANDYFLSMFSTSDRMNVYNKGAYLPYPALGYLFFYFLYRLSNYGMSSLLQYSYGMDILKKMYAEPNSILIYQIYDFILFALLILLVYLFLNKKSIYKIILISFMLLFSWPFFNSIKSGNPASYASILSAFGIYFWAMNKKIDNIYLKQNKWRYNYIPLIFISLAAGIKILPCIYGLLYIKDRDIKNTIKLLLIGSVFMFVPFIFFGGFNSIINFFINLAFRNKWIFGEISIGAYIVTVFEKIVPNMTYEIKELIFNISRNIFLIVCLIFFFLSKRKWQSVMCLTMIISSYISSAYSYNLTYMIAPFMLFLLENDKKVYGKRNNILTYIIFILFVLLFTIPFYMYFVPVINHIYAKIFLLVVLPLYIFSFISILYDNLSDKSFKKNKYI